MADVKKMKMKELVKHLQKTASEGSLGGILFEDEPLSELFSRIEKLQRVRKAAEQAIVNLNAIRIATKGLKTVDRYSFTNQADAIEVENTIGILVAALSECPEEEL